MYNKNNRNLGGGGYFFVILITRVTIATIISTNWNKLSYVTITITPFLSEWGLTAYRFLGSTFKHTIPERRTGDKPVFSLTLPRPAGAAWKPSLHFGPHAFPACLFLGSGSSKKAGTIYTVEPEGYRRERSGHLPSLGIEPGVKTPSARTLLAPAVVAPLRLLDKGIGEWKTEVLDYRRSFSLLKIDF